MPISIEYIADHFHELLQEDSRFQPWLDRVTAYQKEHIPVYGRFSGEYLPIEAFETEALCTRGAEGAERLFRSSGTSVGTGSGAGSKTNCGTKSGATREDLRASHHVASLNIYRRSIIHGFSQAFGSGPFIIVDYLPHYDALGNESSLIYMTNTLRAAFGTSSSGSCLGDEDVLNHAIRESLDTGVPIVLIGAAFGLMDLIETRPIPLPASAIVVETGGMKTHRREISRSELHGALSVGFHLPEERIQSEYGMCELLSQCYTRLGKGNGTVFYPPPWMKFEVLGVEDPGRRMEAGQEGVLAVSDMANIHSVSRILTEDLVVQVGSGFEVLGRLSQADLRGCNFLMEA